MGRYEFSGRTDLRKAAAKRRADAWALYEAGEDHLKAAMYLAGYAIECKLKAIAMETFSAWTLRELADIWSIPEGDVFSHGLEALVERLPLRSNMRSNGAIWKDFAGRVNGWRPSWRYDPHRVSREKAAEFLHSVDRIYRWLDANRC